MRQIFVFTLFYLILFTVYCLLFTSTASAAGEFSISYDNFYVVDDKLNFNVTQNVKITNLTTQYYAAEFAISIGNVKIDKVLVTDESGLIPADLKFTGSETLIKLKFNTPVVGKGQSKSFTLNYSAPELINKAGQIVEVSIPKLASATDINQFNVTLTIPASLGPAAFITPDPVFAQTSGFSGKYDYSFDKSKLLLSGVSAAFGAKQVFSFNLTYHLFNQKTVQTEIALPADDAYQKVFITEIDPEPKDVRVDSDGNWMAHYDLAGGKPKDVRVLGFAEVYPRPKFKINNPTDSQKYLESQQYWEVNSDYFLQKAKELKTPKQIYDFVTSLLSYNQEKLSLERIDRLGATAVTKNPKDAVCMEFTDLFITLARGAGIPAREVNGFGVSSNARLRPLSLRGFGGDILHAWPEYWDEQTQTWIQVDPTWGSTSGGLDYFSKMDFAHISFVHKGLSSTYPVPAGGYKTDPSQAGDVRVEFAKDLPEVSFAPSLQVVLSKNLLSGFSTNGKIIVKNSSNQAQLLDPLKIQTRNLNLRSPAEIKLGILPPSAVREIEFEVDSTGLIDSKKGEVLVSFGPLSASATTQIRPSVFFILFFTLAGFTILAGVVFGLLFVFKKALRHRFW